MEGKGSSRREKPIEKQETKPRVPTMCSAKKKKKKKPYKIGENGNSNVPSLGFRAGSETA